MKLIKEGRKPVFAKLFECPDCHSIFEAERGEYNTKTEEFMGTEYHAVCPFCGAVGEALNAGAEKLLKRLGEGKSINTVLDAV